MIRTLLTNLVLEGEPDGGAGGGAITQEAPAETPVDPGQQTPETPASETPAEVSGETPAEEAVESPSDDLTEDDWTALYEKYPDRDPNKVKTEALAEARKELASKPERAKAQDPFFNAVTQQANDSYARISAASKKLVEGELESTDDLLADIAATGAWQAASERRGHIAVNKAVMERELGIEGGDLDDSNPIHAQYGEMLTSLEATQQNAFRLRNQAVREYDPQKRADILTRAEIMDAHAVGDFYHQTIKLAAEKGKADGKAEAEKSFGKRAPALAEKARTNGHTEAIAKARQTVMAGKAMSSGAEPAKPVRSGPLTVEEAQTLPIDELIRRSKAQ